MTIRYALASALALAALAARADGPTTNFSGTAFVDFTYRQNEDNGTSAAADKANGTAFDIKRFYLTVDHTFDEVWAARFRTDIGNETNGKYDVFVKNAYLQATVAPELVLRAGAADLPWFPFLESQYGFRFIENVLDDRVKFGTSADWGLHAGGKLADGVANYALSVVNGLGYSNPTRTRGPTVEGRVAVNPLKELTIAVAAQDGTLGQDVVGTKVYHDATRYDAVVAWVGGGLRLGVSGMLADNYYTSIVTSNTAKTDSSLGVSGWASYAFDPITILGRYDYFKPHKDTNSALKEQYFNLGLDYKAGKPVDIALVFKHDQVNAGSIAGQVVTSNGTIGSVKANNSGTYQEFGLWGQYVF